MMKRLANPGGPLSGRPPDVAILDVDLLGMSHAHHDAAAPTLCAVFEAKARAAAKQDQQGGSSRDLGKRRCHAAKYRYCG
jgi:hypothetical protein